MKNKLLFLVILILLPTLSFAAFSFNSSGGGKKITATISNLTPKGAYSPATPYSANDVAIYNGQTWWAIQASTGQTPSSNSLYWMLPPTGTTGATGPQGPQGVQGPQGNQGTQGPKGNDGEGVSIGTDGTYGWLTDSNTSSYTECASGKYGLNFVGGVLYQCSNGTNSVFASGGTWGSITGTLADQTDLQAALNAKASTSYVDTAIAGVTAGNIPFVADTTPPSAENTINYSRSDHKFRFRYPNGDVYASAAMTLETAADTTPDAFAFTDVTDAALSTVQTATPVQITGINYPTAVTASGGTAAICTGATTDTCGTFSASPGNVALNQYVSAQHASSGSNSTAVDTTVTIGGVSDVFTSTTAAGSAGYSDSFTGADDTPLATHDANWMSPGSTYLVSSLEIIGNGVTTTGGYSIAGAYYSASTSDISQAVTKAVSNSAQSVEKMVTVRNSASLSGYSARLLGSATGTYTSAMFRKSGGGLGSTCSGLSYSTTADHTIRIEASGTSTVTLTFFVDGTQVCQATDSTDPLPVGHPGFIITGNGTIGNNHMDDWRDY